MINMRTRVATAAILMFLAVNEASAQYQPGDVIVNFQRLRGTQHASDFLAVSPTGGVTTVAANMPFYIPTVMPAPDNRSLWFSGHDAIQSVFGRIAPDGTVTSFYRGSKHEFIAMDVDGGGGVIAADGRGRCICRVDRASFVTSIHSGAPINWPQGGGIDLSTGDFVLKQNDGIYRADVLGRLPVTTILTGSRVEGHGLLHTHPADGSMVQSCGWSIQKLDIGPSGSGTLTTLTKLPFFSFALDRDPCQGDYVFTMGDYSRGHFVVRYNVTANRLSTIAALGPGIGGGGGTTVGGSRHLCPGQSPTPGGSYQLLVSSPAEPGANYVVALSFAFRPGIRVASGRTVYLVPDALFHLSLTNAGIFSGFQGRLDSKGEAVATVQVPAIQSLRGIRFFAACVTLVGGRVSVTSDTVGATIR